MTFKLLAPIALLLGSIFLLLAGSRKDPIADVTVILENFGSQQISRQWYGGETFCAFGSDDNTTATLSEFLAVLNQAYDSDFKLVTASAAQSCPDYTSIYVMISPPVSAGELADILEAQAGSRPPISEMNLTGLRGFALQIPGNRRREFIYVDSTVPSVSNNSDPVRSILLEEVVHALTTLGDFDSAKILSVLGKNLDVDHYDEWFEKNPSGLCLADLYLLEMMIGQTVGDQFTTQPPLAWLADQAGALGTLIEGIKPQLTPFMDARCVG
ncbi:hypothetical protein [Actibacterium sp. 188UL27-1]|uniref:hypothetical protein n=1 Tax=Actibacterium sp. 188UL27-1 TaxID=2786961 RepID=UPI001959DAAD|nr:hypothetical protein [Actibacterium sp. 188UL27-1]MBM7068650.1 hypothetical protein [Actibacterium sp. 188UL27-1]